MRSPLALLVLCLACLPACSSNDSSSGGPAASGGAGGGGGAAGAGGFADAAPDSTADAPSDGESAACLAQDSKLQAALDGARTKTGSRDATFSITTPECGQHVYVSGESGLTGTELFRIGSVSKTYTAAVVLQLVSEGKLSLEDHLDQWVSSVPNAATITIRMLLNHTSGIFNYTNDPSFLSQPKKVWTPDELVAIATANGPSYAPGEKWSYSNTNFILLAMIAEKLTGESIAVSIRKRLLDPAGLEHTFFDGEETPVGEIAPGFHADGSDATYDLDPSGPWAAGAMLASPADTANWVERLVDGKELDPAMQKEMQTGVPVGSPNVTYGLGLLMLGAPITGGAGPGLGHDGSINGYHTQAFRFPETQVTIVSIVNQDGTDPNELTLAALLALFQ
jgi:D-alanyl-D-alanine carboxypeptidase